MGKTWKDDTKRGHRLKFPRVPAMKSSGSGAHQNKGRDARAIRRQYREEIKYGWERLDDNGT